MGMGAASSCKTFEQIITALEWIAHNKGHCRSKVHILDDFFVGPTREEVALNLCNFKEICTMIGIPLATEKTFEPARVIDFMVITLDAELMEARLPDDKIIRMRKLLLEFQNKTTCTLKKLLSLLRLLNFACSVIRPDRTFLCRLINLSIGVKELHHFVRINKEAQLDVLVWFEFLSNFNGKVFFSCMKNKLVVMHFSYIQMQKGQ